MDSSKESSHSQDASSPPPTADHGKGKGSPGLYTRIYKSVGFTRGYNFPLWIIFAGGIFAFCLSRLPELHNYDETFKHGYALAPGLWYYFRSGVYRVGMRIHLAAVLPAGILLVLQFTPVIRHRWLLLHRINGYLVITLFFISNVGAFMLLRHKQSGNRMGIQAAEALLSIATTVGMALAWWNIRRKQVEQHRAWMLRTMIWYGAIISSRLVNLAATPLAAMVGGHWAVATCDEIDFINGEYGLPFPAARYPQCFASAAGGGSGSGTTPTLDRFMHVPVSATMDNGAPEEIAASIMAPFAASLWISMVLHAVGVEIYLHLTPRETERLRAASHQKQLEAGFRHPGSAGLTADRLGDAEPWSPPASSASASAGARGSATAGKGQT